jgi:TatD DNase family protein
MKYIDIHCHLNFPEYDADREEVIKRAQTAEIGIINVGTDIPMSEKAVELAHKYENMWATVAIHPTSTKEAFDFSVLEKLAEDPKVVAIGECGLDYFRSLPKDIARQREVFLEHIELANKVNKPLMLHIRNGKENLGVYKEAAELLKKHSKVRANFHFFAGTIEDLKLILDINGTVSFTGVVTFVRSYDEIVKYVPADRIMSETDAPFVAPAPHRGKRNEPLFIKEIVASLSSQIIDNAHKMFGI